MKTESCNRKRLLIGLILIVMLIVLTGGIATTYAKNSSANSDLVSASETNTDIAYLSDMNDEFSMTNNQLVLDSLLSYVESGYGENVDVSFVNGVKKMVISDNDNITQYIPARLFKEVGVTQHVGKKYGFYIETKKPFTDNAMLHQR